MDLSTRSSFSKTAQAAAEAAKIERAMVKKTKSQGGRITLAENHAKLPEATTVTVVAPEPSSSSPPSASKSKRQRNAGDLLLEGQQRRKPAAEGEQAEPEDLVFEDPFGDEFEPEEMDQEAEGLESIEEGAGDCDVIEGEGATVERSGSAAVGAVGAAGPSDAGMEIEGEEPRHEQEMRTKVWRAGVDELTEGEELEYDSTAYHMYHSLRPEWPCLSFDVIRDGLGANRSRFPHTIFAVAGTQADRPENNRLQVMKTVFMFLSVWRWSYHRFMINLDVQFSNAICREISQS